MFEPRSLRESDIPLVDPLLMAAFGNPKSFAPRLRRLLALEPEGWIVVESLPDGDADPGFRSPRPAGMGGLIQMEGTAYIGLVATDLSLQHRGVATLVMRRLLELARERGCERVLLDASSAGRPLYEKLGFVADDEVRLFAREAVFPASGPATKPVPDDGQTCRPEPPTGNSGLFVSMLGCTSDLTALCDLDAASWGARRDRVLASYAGDDPGSVFLARDGVGSLQGYAIVQRDAGIIGPFVSKTVEVAEALLDAALSVAGDAAITAYVPGRNTEAAALFHARGFVPSKTLTHMRLGSPLDPRRRLLVYSQANFAVG